MISPPAIYLEVARVSRPALVRAVGQVAAVPAVGDFVQFELKSDVGFGYVKSRRWDILREGNGIVVRCWIQDDPP